MIGVRLHGGLGNQLFQYAAARRLSEIHRTEVVLNTRHVAGRSGRSYELGAYNLDVRVDSQGWVTRDTLIHRYGPFATLERVEEPWPPPKGPQAWFTQLPDDVLLQGYWQSRLYIEPIRSILRSQLQLTQLGQSAQRLAIAAGEQTVVSVHVRRGDYVTDPAVAARHGSLDVRYYHDALEAVRAMAPEARIWIFSDDPSWCRAHLALAPDQLVVSDGSMTATEELDVMRRCTHHVIANSTFSWWGAWLAEDANRVVVVPRRWFAQEDIDEACLVRPGWTIL